MIWLKRLLPFVIIGGTALGFYLWERRSTEIEAERQAMLAEVTAEVWVASAQYRDDPARFAVFRDSVIEASGLSREEVFGFLKQYESEPEEMLPLAEEVRRLVDSLYRRADSLHREERIRAHDSATRAGD